MNEQYYRRKWGCPADLSITPENCTFNYPFNGHEEEEPETTHLDAAAPPAHAGGATSSESAGRQEQSSPAQAMTLERVMSGPVRPLSALRMHDLRVWTLNDTRVHYINSFLKKTRPPPPPAGTRD